MADVKNPKPDFSGSGAVEYHPAAASADSGHVHLVARVEAQLLAIPGVTSVGVGIGPAGQEALVVGVVDAGVAARLPSDAEGIPLMVQVTGRVDALIKR